MTKDSTQEQLREEIERLRDALARIDSLCPAATVADAKAIAREALER